MQLATFGGGCFWCLDAVYREVRGVHSSECGYAAGARLPVSYEEVCGGKTGHAEVVQLRFDPTRITYRELLEIFFSLHDPTTLNRQGHDVGTQYRSIICFHDEAQAATARELLAELDAAPDLHGRVVTQLEPLRLYQPAEDYHQDYFRKHPGAGYCVAVVAPKLAKFRQTLAAHYGADASQAQQGHA